MKKPIVISKVSLTYSPVEDRMRMTGRVSESEVMVFWLTLRLSQKLVRAVGDFIEKASTIPQGSDPELVLSFQQSAAMVRKEPADPVVAGGDAKMLLVERIDITQRKDVVLLDFFIPDGGSAQLSLSVQNARQWLGVLRMQYQAAGWPMDLWPAWIAGAADKREPSGTSRSVH